MNFFNYLKIGLLVLSFTLTIQDARSQQPAKSVLTDIAESSIRVTSKRYTIAKNYRTLRMDINAMKQLLGQAPIESSENNRNSEVIFPMSMPDGTISNFRIVETSIMEPALAIQHPEIKTYGGQGIDDPTATIKLDLTPHGFHAMVLSAQGSYFIDPYSKGNTQDYICYDKKELIRQNSFVCGVDFENGMDNDIIPASLYAEKSSGTQLRTYRLALAATGEYTAFFGGTVPLALAAMVTSINRVDGIYEREVAIRMILVGNTNLLIYTNAGTDPYTNNNGGTMLSQNITTCNSVIGSANYDIGHVFSTGGGGVAFLGCVCGSSKAGGVTGSGAPVGDGFDVDYVAHEMGHQFGGNHTFNSITGACNGNRNGATAYESGSGITIMAYAGICGSDDLDPHSIAYFHTLSFDEIVNYSTIGNGNTCPVTTSSGNAAPVVTSLGVPQSIPISTPFVLTGTATDADLDPLTYSWEEYDLGPAGAWNVQSTTAPMFMPLSPVTSPSRTFPKLNDVINNTTTVGELLPNQARILKFRLTVRDNRMGGGGVMHPDTTLNISVVNNGGPFAITVPNTAVTYAGGSTQTVTWNVNGTTNAPINCANVKISLSTDGGFTFPAVLLASTANDGTESITLPNIGTTTARIKVEAVGNIFFDMSNVNFIITFTPLSVITTAAISPSTYCPGDLVNVSYTTVGDANAGNIFTVQLSDASGSFGSPVAIGSLSSTTGGTIPAFIPGLAAAGSGYRIRVVSSNPVIVGTDNGSDITVGSIPAPVISGTFSFCAGGSTTLDAGNGYAQYSWSTGASTQTLFVNTASTFTVTVTNGTGCVGSASVSTIINVCCNVVLSGLVTPVLCSGGSSGSIDVSSSNPLGTASYLWDNGSTLEDRTGLSAGTYTVTVDYGSGCTQSQSFIVTQPAALTINGSLTQVTCKGSATGAIMLSPSGANAPYSYLWNNGSTVQNRTGLIAGTYTVTVNDAGMCGTKTATFSVIQPATNLLLNTSKTNVRCFGLSSGKATVSPLGGTIPYTYSWNTFPVQTTATITGLTVGAYTCLVTDASNCTKTAVITITEPSAIVVIQSQTNVTTNGGNDGTASVSVSGGTAPYTYLWNTIPSSTNVSVSGLVAGTYKCTVTDNKGCVKKVTFVISQPGARPNLKDQQVHLTVFPNPTNQWLHLFISSMNNQQIEISLENLSGQVVYKRKSAVFAGEIQINLDLLGLAKGVYILKVQGEQAVFVEQIMMQ